MPTGSGKTLVAIMLILNLFGMYDPKSSGNYGVKILTKQELVKKVQDSQTPSKQKKKVAFLVPTTNLVD